MAQVSIAVFLKIPCRFVIPLFRETTCLFQLYFFVFFFFAFFARSDCLADQFRCNSGYCIESFRLCDGAIDCFDRSDESDCGKSHPALTFHLNETVGFFYEHASIQCKNGEFACFAGEQCVSYTLVCDGHGDCQDFSDEANCSKFFTSRLNDLSISQLHCYPNNLFSSLKSSHSLKFFLV